MMKAAIIIITALALFVKEADAQAKLECKFSDFGVNVNATNYQCKPSELKKVPMINNNNRNSQTW